MFMDGRTYHISSNEMTVFLKTLEEVMEPYETHCQRYILLMGKLNERSYSVSTAGIMAIMKTVAIFPDLREDCEKTLTGFADLADIQVEIIETTQEINQDIVHIQTAFIQLMKTLAETCKRVASDLAE